MRATLPETERSMVRSPISTTSPPMISGLTYSFPQHVSTSGLLNSDPPLPPPPKKKTHLVGNLQLLPLADVSALADGALQAVQRLVVQLLGAGDHDLDLALARGHEHVELLADAREDGEAVVLGQGAEKVLDRLVAGGHRGRLLELRHDLALVAGRQGRGVQDRRQLGVLGEDGGQRGEGLGGLVERRGLHGGGVLWGEEGEDVS